MNLLRAENIELYEELKDEKKVIDYSAAIDYINIIKVTNQIEYCGTIVYYTDDIWDFNDINSTAKASSEYIINFNKAPTLLKDQIKQFAIIYIKMQGKCSSARKRVIAVIDFANWLVNNGVYDFKSIIQVDIEDYYQSKTLWKLNTIISNKTSLQIFFKYQSIYFGNNITNEIWQILKVNNSYIQFVRAETKTKDIPDSFFKPFLSLCVKIMNSTKEEKWKRAVAAMIVILSQTGLRISEALALKKDCIQYIYNKSLNKKCCFMECETTKSVRKVECKVKCSIFVNELTYHSVELLKKIFNEDYRILNTNFLFALTTIKSRKLPIVANRFYFHYIKLGLAVSKKMNIINCLNVKWNDCMSIYKVDDNTTITLPHFHQYRVHLCTELYEKGVPLEYIEKFLNHLSESMEGYYIVPKKTIQENMEFSQKILYDIVSKDLKIIGGDGGISKKIDEFIKNGNYNIVNDINEIVKKLADKIPIRQKAGGVCIKSSGLRECSNDAITNEFYCAYGVCSNICYFFYMIDIAFRQCNELSETIEYNKTHGFIKQVQKELNMFQYIYKKKLVPEYDEMIRMILLKGKKQLTITYPHIEKFIMEADNIKEIMDKWKRKYIAI